MSELIFPPSLTPKSVTWTLERDVRVNPSASGAVSRTTRGLPRWRADVTMPALQDEDRHIFNAFLAEASRGDSHVYFQDHSYSKRGEISSSELLTNNDFSNGTTGWSAAASNHSVNGRLSRVENTSASPGYILQSKNPTLGQPQAFVAFFYEGSAADCRVLIRRESDSSDYVNDTAIPFGLYYATFTPSVSANTRFGIGTGESVSGKDVYIPYVSNTRCILVDGASQTGSTLQVNFAGTSSYGVLELGDLVTVFVSGVPSLHRLTKSLDTNSSGVGILHIEPSLPDSPADNDPVLIDRPFCRMYLPEHQASVANLPAGIGEFSFSLFEDVTR